MHCHPQQAPKQGILPIQLMALWAVIALSPLAYATSENSDPSLPAAVQNSAPVLSPAEQRDADAIQEAVLQQRRDNPVIPLPSTLPSSSPASDAALTVASQSSAVQPMAALLSSRLATPKPNLTLYILLLLLVIVSIITILYFRALIKLDAPKRSARQHPASPHGSQADRAQARSIPHPASQSGAITLPAAKANEPVPATHTPALPPATQSASPATTAGKPVEYIHPVMTTPASSSGLKTNVRYGTALAGSIDSAKVSLYVEQSLDAFARHQPLEPMVYRPQLQHANLDYSAASLTRVDEFLTYLREQTQPEIADYTTLDNHRHLLVFLGFYVATTIARITSQTIVWHDYASLRIWLQNPTLLANLHNSYSCVLGKNNHFMPIELISSILFEANSTRSCSAQLAYAQQHAQSYAPIPRSSQHTVISADTEQERAWVEVIKMAGHLAAKSVYQLQSGSLIPMLMYPKNRVQLVSESLSGDDPTPFLERMKHNPQQLPYQATVYDSSANLPTGVCPALIITARGYGDHAAEWTVMLPYRSAKHADGFAIFTPLLAPSSIPAYYNTLLMHAFYSGVTMISLPGDPWHSHLHES